MPIFEPWDIVRVPFPYTDRPVRQRRPALIVAAGDLQSVHGLLWLAMITSAEHRGWPRGMSSSRILSGAGLPAPSIVRPAKIATIDARDAGRLGTLSPPDREEVRIYLRQAALRSRLTVSCIKPCQPAALHRGLAIETDRERWKSVRRFFA